MILGALLDSLFDRASGTILNLAMKPIEGTAIQPQSLSEIPLILTHIAPILKFY